MAVARTRPSGPAVDENSRNRHGFAAFGAVVSALRAEGCAPTLGGGARADGARSDPSATAAATVAGTAGSGA